MRIVRLTTAWACLNRAASLATSGRAARAWSSPVSPSALLATSGGAARAWSSPASPFDSEPEISILLPVYNAMPWLPRAVWSTLRQEGVSVELIAVDDGCTDGSAEWLLECAALLAEVRGQPISPVTRPRASDASLIADRRRLNPALRLATRSLTATNAAALHIEGSTAGDSAAVALAASAATAIAEKAAGAVGKVEAMSPKEVAEACRGYSSTLIVLHSGGRGQGAALDMAYEASRSSLVGEVEADDESAPGRFLRLKRALGEQPALDGVASTTALIEAQNHRRPGMTRYVQWQNSLTTPEAMRDGRFVEIPALRQTVLFRRAALERMRLPNPCGEGTQIYRDLADWPVDSDFWFRWYELGLVAGKLGPPALYLWRQHAGQSTRTHGRCSLDHLRRCKIHFLLRPGGPADGAREVQIWSRGETLENWVTDVREAGKKACWGTVNVRGMDWKPGAPIPPQWKGRREREGAVVRLFAYGMPKVRERVRTSIRDWDGALDWFVA